MNFGIHLILLKETFTIQPVYLWTCVLPYDISFLILDLPGSCNNDISFTYPHSLLLGTRYPAHTDNSVHTLQSYPVSSKQTGNRCQNLTILFTWGSYPDNFTVCVSAVCVTFPFFTSIISQINTSIV